MNESRPFSITFHHDLVAIVGLSFLLVVTVYLLPFPALGTAGAQSVSDHFTWDRVATRVTETYGQHYEPFGRPQLEVAMTSLAWRPAWLGASAYAPSW